MRCKIIKNRELMLEISRFYGITICLYWKDHNPPHVHFTYGDYEYSISVLDRIVDVVARMNQYKLQKVHVFHVLTYKQPITY